MRTTDGRPFNGGQAVDRTLAAMEEMERYYIKEFTAPVDNGKVTSYRINSKVTFDLETERGKSRR